MKNITTQFSKLLLATLVTTIFCDIFAGEDVPTRAKNRAAFKQLVFGHNNAKKTNTPWNFVLSGALLTTVILYKTCQKIYPGLSLRKFFESKKSVDKSSILENTE